MRTKLFLLVVPLGAFFGAPSVHAASPYFVAGDAWQCPSPGHLVGNHMADKDSGCIPPLGQENVVVMDIDGQFAFVCTPLPIEGLKMTSMYCRYVLTSAITDSAGKRANIEQLKAYAGKQTMQDVRALK